VSTTEVTQVVSVVSGVAEANVYGAEVPGHDGRAGMVAITLGEGITVDSFNWAALVAACKRDLPVYARPLFVRITPAIEITGTFKHKKVELRNEGADPSKMEDKVYYFDSSKEEYTLLTPNVFERICEGELKI
jgi:acyl-CoA synthetase (AMP-forming)/AMP-acid ligase II